MIDQKPNNCGSVAIGVERFGYKPASWFFGIGIAPPSWTVDGLGRLLGHDQFSSGLLLVADGGRDSANGAPRERGSHSQSGLPASVHDRCENHRSPAHSRPRFSSCSMAGI
jgi:hypothetical protein